MLRAAALAALACPAGALMYDTFSPELLPPAECEAGCAPWSARDPTIWRHGRVPAEAGSHCAQVGALVNNHTLGSWCFCNATKPGGAEWGYCTHGMGIPEQINIQVASPDTVVISWVTFEQVAPAEPPVVMIKKGEEAQWTTLRGVTHVHKTAAGDRTYYMHFVRASKLEARARYSYQVRSGARGDQDRHLWRHGGVRVEQHAAAVR
eukprot:TRINITY_DN1176_c0_g1_i9.p2 TRINITY_DN1176_c0_g1~~TRINITY_DN1176_c0_g1_i9.p2  ORF type:complete len:207 (+),score=39.66 TRINITY_DN1176_c0_g1_i9:78-698(+)